MGRAATPRDAGSVVPDLDFGPAPEARSAPEASGARRALPQAQPQGYDPNDPQSMFGSGTFDADYFGDAPGPALEVGDHSDSGARLANNQQVASFGGLELAEDPVNTHADPFANYGSGNLDLGDFDDAPGATSDPFSAPISLAERDLPAPAGSGARAAPQPTGSGPRASLGRIAVAQPREYPLGDTPAASDLPIDPIDVGLAADYPAPPSGWLMTPVYAWKVFMRRREIQEEIGRSAVRLRASEASRDAALAEFAYALRPAIEADTAAVRMLAEVQNLEQAAGERQGTFEAVKQDFESKCAALDQADFDYQIELEELRQLTSVLDRDASDARSAFKRAEIGYKRVEIELRAAGERAARSAAEGTTNSPAEAEIAELEAKRAQLAPDVEEKRVELEAREAPLRENLDRVRAIERDRAGLASERKKLEEEFQRQASVRKAGVSDVQGQAFLAMTEVGREVLRRPGRVEVTEAQLNLVKQPSERVFDCAIELELWVRAEASFEPLGYRRGMQVILGSLGLFVLICVLRVAL